MVLKWAIARATPVADASQKRVLSRGSWPFHALFAILRIFGRKSGKEKKAVKATR